MILVIGLGNTLTASTDWGNDGRLASRSLKTGLGADISHLSYAYDVDDNITGITDAVEAENDVAYAYDPVGRLERVMLVDGPVRRTDFAFDGNGNRTQKSTRPLPDDPDNVSNVESYETDDRSNQLDEISGPAGTRSFTYDGRGNLVGETRPGGVTVSAGYDGHGRLTSYSRTGEVALNHSYNGLGDRVATMTGVDVRRFFTAPDGRAIGEYGASSSDVKAEFIWMNPVVGDGGMFGGDDGLGGYMPLAVAAATATPGETAVVWVHANHMGVPIVYTDASGTALAGPPGDYAIPGFPGQSRTLADLYYNRYRDYDPTTGRYIQADPIGLAGGPSPYSYAMNNPLRYTDPTGEHPLLLILLGGAIGAGIGAGTDLGLQAGFNLWNGNDIWDPDCYDWNSVIISGGLGAISGGYGGAARSLAARTAAESAIAIELRSFGSSSALKRHMGPAGPGNQWHHIVEKTPGNIERFGTGVIQRTDNVVAIPASIHIGKGSISAYYSSIQPGTGGLTVRQWLSTQSLETQRRYGLEILKIFGQ